MNETKYPYVNHMNILHDSLELIDIPSLVKKCTDKWYNQTLCKVNESVVRLGILHGEYHWHKHDNEDEFFFTLDGLLIIDIEGAEYKVIESIIEDDIDVRVLCVEYDEYFNPLDDGYIDRIRESANSLIRNGYSLVCAQGHGNYTFVKNV